MNSVTWIESPTGSNKPAPLYISRIKAMHDVDFPSVYNQSSCSGMVNSSSNDEPRLSVSTRISGSSNPYIKNSILLLGWWYQQNKRKPSKVSYHAKLLNILFSDQGAKRFHLHESHTEWLLVVYVLETKTVNYLSTKTLVQCFIPQVSSISRL